MIEKQNHKWLVIGLCFYLAAAYVFFGALCYLAWRRSVVFTWFGWSWDNPLTEEFRKVTYCWCAGALGAISFSLWQLFNHYCLKKDFDADWTVWYLFGPVSGSLLGIATYSLVMGGLLVLGESMTIRSNWAVFALAFLAGFSTKKVFRKLDAIAGQIFQPTEKEEVEPKPSK